MPGSGVNILWNENSPAETDIADAAPIRSIETSIRNALAVEHNFLSTGGANTGYHLLGSARAFYDVESNVSSSGTDGRLYVASDTSRIFHVGSAGTMLLGAASALVMGTQPAGGQRFYWAIETGRDVGSGSISFPNGAYNGQPFVLISAISSPTAQIGASVMLETLSPTFFTYHTLLNTGTILPASANSVCWLSIGTRTL